MLCPLSYRRTNSRSIITENCEKEHRFPENAQSYPHRVKEHRFPLGEAVDNYLLSCKVEGKSPATVKAYKSKLYPFLWYAAKYNLPDDVTGITLTDVKEFIVYLRDNPIRFGGMSNLSRKPVNKTTVQRYYRVLSGFWNWLLAEGLANENPLHKIKTPGAERKIIKAFNSEQIKELLSNFDNSFDRRRNKAIVLILADAGLRLGELLRLRLEDVDTEHQLIEVQGKTGERVVINL